MRRLAGSKVSRRYDASRIRTVVFVCLLLFATGMAWASWSPDIHVQRVPWSLHLGEVSVNTWSQCLREAAFVSGVDPALLQAIVTVESGDHPYAFGWFDHQGTRRSYKAATYTAALAQLDALERRQIRFDVGLAQVNSRNLMVLERRTGMASVHALDPCTNLRFAGIILREQIGRHGPTWRAVAGYNGALAYVPKVRKIYCARMPDASACDRILPLSELLCEPIPVSQTERYYKVFRTHA
ncbi:MAG TPA: transglycosylase SLT domain-containing protein [Nitrospiraceae bacterium]|nr:transglycosylase SLT domain-containing protein [Nitrospiraceae bacterium]